MRCLPGWDTRLKAMLAQAQNQSEFGKAVISSYPPDYDSSGTSGIPYPQSLPIVLCADRFDDEGTVAASALTSSDGISELGLIGPFKCFADCRIQTH